MGLSIIGVRRSGLIGINMDFRVPNWVHTGCYWSRLGSVLCVYFRSKSYQCPFSTDAYVHVNTDCHFSVHTHLQCRCYTHADHFTNLHIDRPVARINKGGLRPQESGLLAPKGGLLNLNLPRPLTSGVATGWHGGTMSRGLGAKGAPERETTKKKKKNEE